MYAIVALGPNSVEVPCLIFQTEKAALDFMKSTELPESNSNSNSNSDAGYWEVPDEWSFGEAHKPFWDRFFTGYYFGCGEVCAFVLREVQKGKPFVCFDLD